MLSETNTLKLPELLAPAGDETCLHAAVRGGADAVYLGLDTFNARRNAANFTLETLKAACDYCHLRGVKVYVTMNIEILPHELTGALKLALEAYARGADGIIVQDIGLAYSLTKLLPEFPLHLSTQMNIHNQSGVELAYALGAKRITLARELSLSEIQTITAAAAEAGIETECFAHGALCVCYSGQCLMSSMIGGRSANRGLCAQPCRLPYQLESEQDGNAISVDVPGSFLLSPRDLSTIHVLPDLVQTGVSSLKIEGRMKSPEYVYTAVSTYREALDDLSRVPDTKNLEEAFSRGFTSSYLDDDPGQRNSKLMGYTKPNNRGILIGRVSKVSDDWIDIRLDQDLNAGDLLEFWTNKGNFTAEVEHNAVAKSTLRLNMTGRASKGDRVFRVRNAHLRFEDAPFEPRIPVRGYGIFKLGRPARLGFHTTDGVCIEVQGDVVETARTKEIAENEIFEHINRMGQSSFCLDSGAHTAPEHTEERMPRLDTTAADCNTESAVLDLEVDAGIGMSFSSLHHLRDDALALLTEELLAPWNTAEREKAASIASDIPNHLGLSAPSYKSAQPYKPEAAEICAFVTNPTLARVAKKAGATRIYVPLLNFKRGQAAYAGLVGHTKEQAGYPKHCIMALPVVNRDNEKNHSFDCWDYVRSETPVLVENLNDLSRAIELEAHVEVGPRIPVTNKASLEFLHRIGVKRVWLSPELTLGQIATLAEDAPIPLGIFISGAQELMVTEQCVLSASGNCSRDCSNCSRRQMRYYLRDRKDYRFPVISDMDGRSHIYNGIELDNIAALPDLIDAGISSFMVDATLWEREETQGAIKRALRAIQTDAHTQKTSQKIDKRPHTTTGHLFRGVS